MLAATPYGGNPPYLLGSAKRLYCHSGGARG